MYPKGNLFIPASHGRLETIIKEPGDQRRGVAVVAHPHPLGGGTMHNKVVFRVAAGLVDAGLLTVRFNFRGVGASTGEHNEVEGGVEDVRDVLDYVEQNYPGEDLTLAGFSFGSRTSMQAGWNDPRVARLISVGTPVEKYRGYDFLVNVQKPIIFIHGDKDEFCSVETLRTLTDRIEHAEVVIFENCGHFFDEQLNELRDTVCEWVKRKLATDEHG
ncbi:MAG: alpha/beta hydrolase [Pyrinomonadaceae bacterium]